MACVLLSEPDPDVRRLLTDVLERAGHEAVAISGLPDGELPEGDLLVAEPADGAGRRQAWALRRRDPSLPIVLVSIFPPESALLALAPSAYLVKPFPIARLEQVVAAALA